mmetsp:Transcript_11045/g.28386  ORF Transcript_11045/g.28386 Transcript_11045/m.28386 type:complete len:226 (+) Transcript_11045:67-744(+)
MYLPRSGRRLLHLSQVSRMAQHDGAPAHRLGQIQGQVHARREVPRRHQHRQSVLRLLQRGRDGGGGPSAAPSYPPLQENTRCLIEDYEWAYIIQVGKIFFLVSYCVLMFWRENLRALGRCKLFLSVKRRPAIEPTTAATSRRLRGLTTWLGRVTPGKASPPLPPSTRSSGTSETSSASAASLSRSGCKYLSMSRRDMGSDVGMPGKARLGLGNLRYVRHERCARS